MIFVFNKLQIFFCFQNIKTSNCSNSSLLNLNKSVKILSLSVNNIIDLFSLIALSIYFKIIVDLPQPVAWLCIPTSKPFLFNLLIASIWLVLYLYSVL